MKLRKAQNLTSKKLGEQIGITESGVLGYENEITYPSRNVLLRLVDTLGNDILCDDYSKFIIKQYGPIIKQWRKEQKLTCDQAAKYIGTSQRTLFSLENMEYIISRNKFNELKAKLKVIVL